MKYYVRFAGRTLEVEVQGSRVTVDGVHSEAHLAAVAGTPLYHLLLASGRGMEGESWTVAVQPLEGPVGGRWALGAVGERFEVEVVDQRTREMQALTVSRPQREAGATITAPMPGLVVRLEVAEGQRVEAGAGVVVVEAMKMENELRAPSAGVVTRIHVAVGAAVERGAPLVTLESAEPSR